MQQAKKQQLEPQRKAKQRQLTFCRRTALCRMIMGSSSTVRHTTNTEPCVANNLYPIIHDLTEAECRDDRSDSIHNTNIARVSIGEHQQRRQHSDLSLPTIVVESPRQESSPLMPPTSIHSRHPGSKLRRSVSNVTASFRFSPLVRETKLEACQSQDSITVGTDCDNHNRRHHHLDAALSIEEEEPVSTSSSLSFDDIYVLTRPIRNGHSSYVWECIHRPSASRFAVKMVNKRSWSAYNTVDDEMYSRREVQILQSLAASSTNVSNILVARAVLESATHLHVVTDFCAGGNLTSALQSMDCQGRLSERLAIHLTRSLLEGVACLHSHGICHNQLTPDHLLLTAAPPSSDEGTCWSAIQIKIADFGLAIHQRSLLPETTFVPPTSLLSRLSNWGYAAPELVQRGKCTARADMWSVGACVYYLLHGGRPPFGKTLSKRMLVPKIAVADYDLTSPQLSRHAKLFVSSLMHIHPQARLTADEALDHQWLLRLEKDGFSTTMSSEHNATHSSGQGPHSRSSWVLRKCKQSFCSINI